MNLTEFLIITMAVIWGNPKKVKHDLKIRPMAFECLEE